MNYQWIFASIVFLCLGTAAWLPIFIVWREERKVDEEKALKKAKKKAKKRFKALATANA